MTTRNTARCTDLFSDLAGLCEHVACDVQATLLKVALIIFKYHPSSGVALALLAPCMYTSIVLREPLTPE